MGYSIRVPLAHQLVDGRTSTVLSAPVYLDGALVAAATCAARLYNEVGNLVATADTGTVTGGIATLTVLATELASESRGVGWRVEWDIVLQDDGDIRAQVDACYVRRELHPVITHADLYGRHRMLDPDGARSAHSLTSGQLQGHMDEAWTVIRHRLEGRGDRADLVMSPTAFREVHLYMSLALIFDDIAEQTGSEFLDRARDYMEMAERAYSELTWVADDNDDGVPDRGGKRRGGSYSVWL